MGRLESRNELITRMNARLDEVEAIKAEVMELSEVKLLAQQLATGTLMHAGYNLGAWHGGKDAYQCVRSSSVDYVASGSSMVVRNACGRHDVSATWTAG
jgi:hypothetical protein